MSDSGPQAAAGWYPHSRVPELERYWDGTAWTEQVRPRAAAAAPPPGPAPAPRRSKSRASWPLRLVVIGGVVLAAGILWFFLGYNSDESQAERACHDYVEDSLKSPATAEFSDEFATDQGDGTWRVHGTVDSENGFGAMVRNDFTCEVSKVAGEFRVDDADYSEG